MITFKYPQFLFCVPLSCIVLYIFLRFSRKKRERLLSKLVASKLYPLLLPNYSSKRYAVKDLFFVIGILLLGIAIASPRNGFHEIESKQQGANVLIAVDISQSMLAEDIAPNRLERTKIAIWSLTENLSGHSLGLIAFSGVSFLQCPLTLDHQTFFQSVNALDTKLLPVQGTSLSAPIKTALKVFNEQNNNTEKILVLFSDGENFDEEAIKYSKKSASNGIKIYTVGVGSAEGATIPVTNEYGSKELLRDRDGHVVHTKLNESVLLQIAQNTNGTYGLFSDVHIERLKNTINEALNGESSQSHTERVYNEIYYYFLGACLLCFVISILLTPCKKYRFSKIYYGQVFVWLIAFVPSLFTDVFSCDSKGEKWFNSGNFKNSSEYYANKVEKYPDNFFYKYNHGTSLLAEQKYQEAISVLKSSLATQDLELQKKVLYNLGNAEFENGNQKLDKNVHETIPNWEDSIKYYENALDIDENFAFAKENLEYVKKKLKDLKNQQNQKNNDQNNDKDNKSDDDKQNNNNQEQNDKNSGDNSNKNQENNQNNKNDSDENKENKSDQDKDKNDQNEGENSESNNDTTQEDKNNSDKDNDTQKNDNQGSNDKNDQKNLDENKENSSDDKNDSDKNEDGKNNQSDEQNETQERDDSSCNDDNAKDDKSDNGQNGDSSKNQNSVPNNWGDDDNSDQMNNDLFDSSQMPNETQDDVRQQLGVDNADDSQQDVKMSRADALQLLNGVDRDGNFNKIPMIMWDGSPDKRQEKYW